jgi:sulfur carrier protein ThiS
MKVRIKFYGAFASGLQLDPGQAIEVEVPPHATLSELVRQLGIPEDSPWIALVNGIHRLPGERLQEGDEIAVFPPLGGGA